jgi:hypothetical protein
LKTTRSHSASYANPQAYHLGRRQDPARRLRARRLLDPRRATSLQVRFSGTREFRECLQPERLDPSFRLGAIFDLKYVLALALFAWRILTFHPLQRFLPRPQISLELLRLHRFENFAKLWAWL